MSLLSLSDILKIGKAAPEHRAALSEMWGNLPSRVNKLNQRTKDAVVNTFTGSTLAIPEDLAPRVSYRIKDLPENSVAVHSFFPNTPKDPGEIWYNARKFASEGAPVAGAHEITHDVTRRDLPSLKGTRYWNTENLNNFAKSEAYQDALDSLDPKSTVVKHINLASPADRYVISPVEDIARNVQRQVPPELSQYPSFRTNFPEILRNAGTKAITEFEAMYKPITEMAPNWKNYLPAAGAVGLGLGAYEAAAPEKGEAALLGKLAKAPKDIDAKTISEVKDFLLNSTASPSPPPSLYRGIPKGASPETAARETYTHASPWAEVAGSAGKGPFASGETDIYKYDVLPETKYFRGGSLAGDPLEQTSVGSAKGTDWQSALGETKRFFDKTLNSRLTELLSYGLKGDDLLVASKGAADDVASEAILQLKKGTFETDAFAKPGIWEGQEVPSSLNRTRPSLRSNDELKAIVGRAQSEGKDITGLPEYKILKGAGLLGAGATLLPSHTNAAMSKNDITPGEGGAKELGKVNPKSENKVSDLGGGAFDTAKELVAPFIGVPTRAGLVAAGLGALTAGAAGVVSDLLLPSESSTMADLEVAREFFSGSGRKK